MNMAGFFSAVNVHSRHHPISRQIQNLFANKALWSRIPYSWHLPQTFNRKILDVALLCRWIYSIRSGKSAPNPDAIPDKVIYKQVLTTYFS